MNKYFFILLFIPFILFSKTHGIYINRYVASSEYFYDIVDKMKEHSMNAVVIDVKYDRGEVSVKTDDVLLIGAYQPINNLKQKIEYLKENNIKPIARIVSFKDNILSSYNNYQYAIKYTNKKIFKDLSNTSWVSPYSNFVREYLINIAKEAIELGFEEIQFDYIRFPNDFPKDAPSKKLFYPEYNGKSRFQIIEDFLKQAYMELKQYNVDISADLFGYTVWYDSLGAIAQNLNRISKYTDIIYPMVYPSHFGDKFLYKNSYEQRTYDIVYQSAVNGINRTLKYNTKIILYIQDFDWKKSKMGKNYILNQINACLNSPADGFVLWNPSSIYNIFKLNIKYSIEKQNYTIDTLNPVLR